MAIIRELTLDGQTKDRFINMRETAADVRDRMGMLTTDQVLAQWAGFDSDDSVACLRQKLHARHLREQLQVR